MRGRLEGVKRIDAAIYAAVARTDAPGVDLAMRRLTRAADFSKLWVVAAAGLGLVGERRAAARGLSSIAVTATCANAIVKPLSRRRRPQRGVERVAGGRFVVMPASTSFPSGHTASAFAFATGVGHLQPAAAPPLYVAAALVGYSRVHTGVHYPSDVVAGALLGVTLAQLTNHLIDLRTRREARRCPAPGA